MAGERNKEPPQLFVTSLVPLFSMVALIPLTGRQQKCILTVWLLAISDSISFVQAIKFWSSVEQPPPPLYSNTASDDSNCNAPPPPSSPMSLLPRSRVVLKRMGSTTRQLLGGHRGGDRHSTNLAKSCADYCSGCLNKNDITKLCSSKGIITRGGHSAAAAATATAEAIGEAAAANAGALTPYGLPLNAWKVIFQVILTFINVFCWFVPLRSKKVQENKKLLSLANAFSGGVFLSLAFGHLIPECVHGFHGYDVEVAPFMLVLGGYLLIFFVEKVAFSTHDILHEMEDTGKKQQNGHNHAAAAAAGRTRSAVILLGALAVHSVLEMTALGLADTFGDCALLTLSIALHQVRIHTIGPTMKIHV